MPLLLLFPLLAVVVAALWVVLLPLTLRQRYRAGSARRRAHGWVLRVNAWVLSLSLPTFVLTAWLAGRWSPEALPDAGIGLALGVVVGLAGVALLRIEHDDERLYYTPNRWLTLLLTLAVALRILLGVFWTWRRASGADAGAAGWELWLDAGGLWTVGGLLLGYAATLAVGLHRRVARRRLR